MPFTGGGWGVGEEATCRAAPSFPNAVDLRPVDRAEIIHPGTLFSPRLTEVVLAGGQSWDVANWIPANNMPE